MASCETGKLEAAKWLVDHGADVLAVLLAPGCLGQLLASAAMTRAAAFAHIDIMRYLYAQAAPFTVESGGQRNTALHEAAIKGHTECVRFILACGFAIETRKTDGVTALHMAAEGGRTAVIELLLDSGADIEAKDDNMHTPLMHAMGVNDAEAVTQLVTRGAIISDGTAAAFGAKFGSIAALKALMTSPQWLAMSRTEHLDAECGLLFRVKDKPTFDAVRSLVLDMSVLVTHRTSEEDNALHYAAQEGRAVPLICAFIKEGVDPTASNTAGQTPADVAREAGHALQATLLERAADDKRKRDLQQQQ